jgi:copper homeostasis protein (lipoprotein)
MRHNSAMVPIARTTVCLAALALAGCARAPSSDAPIPGLGSGDGEAAWAGVLPCADCRGIDTRLLLQRQGAARRYRLIEVYLSDEGGARFVEDGEWQQVSDGLLRLQDEHGRRFFAVVRGGGLQPRDADGDPFLGRDSDVLSPLSQAASAP